MRERPLLWCLVIVVAANAMVFAALAHDAYVGNISLAATIVYAQTAVGTSALAVGGFSWALSTAAQPLASVERIEAAMPKFGALPAGARDAATMPAREVRFRDLRFAYPGSERPIFDGFDLTIPAGSSLAIVGQNGAGKTTLAKLFCRLYDPQAGAIEIDGVDLKDLDLAAWRSRVTAVFQDFVRYELPLRENVAPLGAADAVITAALERAGGSRLATLDAPMSRAYAGGTDLSGGQWQRVALARALCAVSEGASLVILDEPTAQLDVRGEAEIFERVLAATRDCTTILISHRFSTVRLADRICVVEQGRVIELGSHDELMALGGRYRTMFDLQAARFGEESDDEEAALESLA
jgi:ABC-type multidrug transport system fused ATPase/permease subunit